MVCDIERRLWGTGPRNGPVPRSHKTQSAGRRPRVCSTPDSSDGTARCWGDAGGEPGWGLRARADPALRAARPSQTLAGDGAGRRRSRGAPGH